MSVLLNTSLGDIVIDLHTEICPVTTKNFLKLCKIKYFNNCLFHSVQKDFLVQTGDPTGTGSGGDSIYKYLYGDQARFFEDEIRPDLKHDKIGVVAMANAGANLNASQFYITTRAELDYLDEKKTIFGEVAEGIDTLMRINEAYVDENNRPYKNIRIKHTYVLDDPFDDPPQLSDLIPDKSPDLKPPAEGDEVRLEDDWVPMDEQQDPEELEKSLRSKEAHSRAVVLEMIGDIPEAEIKPPENVLFICKLNPVTQEEDLEILFSRFGKTISVDIIKDYKTGDSLCYGFIEFETTEACEAAYFKMDNVLIDDRRVHVDFSQSVSKLWTRFRRFGTRDSGAATNYTPQTKGRGCFKCGELGHIAKDCTAEDAKEPNAVLEKPKYILKDIGGQHGDQRNKSYEMVFDERSEASYVQESRKAGNVHDGSSMKQRRGEGSERRSSPGMSDHKRRRSESPSYYESKDRHGKLPQSATTRNREGTHDGYVPKPDGKERREWEREQGRDKGKIPEYKEKRSTLHTKREDRSVAVKFDRTEGDPRNRDDDVPPKHRSRDETNSSHRRDFEKHKDRHRDDRTEHRKHENSDETLSIVERRIDRNGRNIDRNEDKERDHRHHCYHDRASSASRGYQDNSNRRDREKAEYSMNDDRKEREHRRDGNLNKAYYAKGNKQEDEQSKRYTERPREKHKYREKEH